MQKYVAFLPTHHRINLITRTDFSRAYFPPIHMQAPKRVISMWLKTPINGSRNRRGGGGQKHYVRLFPCTYQEANVRVSQCTYTYCQVFSDACVFASEMVVNLDTTCEHDYRFFAITAQEGSETQPLFDWSTYRT